MNMGEPEELETSSWRKRVILRYHLYTNLKFHWKLYSVLLNILSEYSSNYFSIRTILFHSADQYHMHVPVSNRLQYSIATLFCCGYTYLYFQMHFIQTALYKH